MSLVASRWSNSHRLDHLTTRLSEIQSRAARARYLANAGLELTAEWSRERLERRDLRRLLAQARAGRESCALLDDPEPLVTILVPTYNRGRLLAERAIDSALHQTYRNLEILIVGDNCDAETATAATSTGDPRVRFVNLGGRGMYPDIPEDRWWVAGATPVNIGMWLARGAWIAPCDDDDRFSPDHVELLLAFARENRLEMVYSRALAERSDGEWVEIGSPDLRHAQVSHGTVLYASALRFVSYSETCWKLLEPSDWNRWRRFRDIGVRIGYLDEVTYHHFAEGRHRVEPTPH